MVWLASGRIAKHLGAFKGSLSPQPNTISNWWIWILRNNNNTPSKGNYYPSNYYFFYENRLIMLFTSCLNRVLDTFWLIGAACLLVIVAREPYSFFNWKQYSLTFNLDYIINIPLLTQQEFSLLIPCIFTF